MYAFNTHVHGGPKFGPLPPPSRDSICMPSQVWSTDFLCEIFDNVINSRQYASLVQSERKSQWTKFVTVCISCHVKEEDVNQTWDPRVLFFTFIGTIFKLDSNFSLSAFNIVMQVFLFLIHP